MSSIVVSGDTSGAITIAAPAVSGTNTLTLPAATGTVALTSQLPVAGPAFSAYLNGSQTVSAATDTKIAFNVEEYDTNSNFASSRFTPTVAGYYQITAGFISNFSTMTRTILFMYKNGSVYKRLFDTFGQTANLISGGCLVYLNGSTDYVEIYGYINGTGTLQFNGDNASFTWITGSMTRGA